MGYLNCGTLQDFLIRHKFKISEEVMADIIHQIAGVINYLYTFGVVHRDLKPTNILIIEEEKVKNGIQAKEELVNVSKEETIGKLDIKIIDFGLAKILGRKENVIEECGSMGFCAPEIILGRSYNQKVDIWSLGVIIYYMCSRELPFSIKNAKSEDIVKNTCNEELKFSSKKFKNFSESLISLIRCCLEKDCYSRISIEKLIDHEWFKNVKIQDNK